MDCDTIKKIAFLARVHLTDDEVNAYTTSVDSIFKLLQQMESINTDDVAPLFHPLEINQRLREDVVTEIDQHLIYQSLAPKTESALYLVPQVIEEHQ